MAEMTPPGIVERAGDPTSALAAFIAQELEHWGFVVGNQYRAESGGITTEVETTQRRFKVTIES